VRAAAVRLTDRRVGLLFAVFLGLLAFASLRAGYLLAFKGDDLKARAATQSVENVTVMARRGTITDRNGAELAVSEDASTVVATPFLIKDPIRTARRIAPLVNRPEPEVLKIIADRSKGFAYIARKIKAANGRKIERLKIEGIGVLDDARRYYPEREKAAQVVGSVGVDNVGLSGVEQQLDEELRGADGEQRIVKDARGTPVSLDELKDGHSGEDIRLTLDLSLQDRAEQVLAGVGRTYEPKGAAAIVMDPRTGDLLAMANWPRVDANRIDEAPRWARVNRAVGFTYEPGSTFKSITVAGALAAGIVRPETAFRVGPQIQVADRIIKEAHGSGGIFTVSDILARSSNVGAVRIGQRLGAKRFDRWVHRFGFGRLTDLPLPGESPGIVPRWREYSGSSIGNLPIGQGLAVTPVQMIAAYAAIANGGILVNPRLVLDGEAPEGRRVLPAAVSARLRRMLEGVLGPTGTAPEAAVEGYEIAGKTGTAEKAEDGGYAKDKFVASFIGFAPAQNPRLLVAVIVDEPRGGVYSGGEVAAPAFEKIASFALPYLGIAPE
jgi:cell division protein FtsI (penicillin-binding protein 3)